MNRLSDGCVACRSEELARAWSTASASTSRRYPATVFGDSRRSNARCETNASIIWASAGESSSVAGTVPSSSRGCTTGSRRQRGSTPRSDGGSGAGQAPLEAAGHTPDQAAQFQADERGERLGERPPELVRDLLRERRAGERIPHRFLGQAEPRDLSVRGVGSGVEAT